MTDALWSSWLPSHRDLWLDRGAYMRQGRIARLLFNWFPQLWHQTSGSRFTLLHCPKVTNSTPANYVGHRNTRATANPHLTSNNKQKIMNSRGGNRLAQYFKNIRYKIILLWDYVICYIQQIVIYDYCNYASKTGMAPIIATRIYPSIYSCVILMLLIDTDAHQPSYWHHSL